MGYSLPERMQDQGLPKETTPEDLAKMKESHDQTMKRLIEKYGEDIIEKIKNR